MRRDFFGFLPYRLHGDYVGVSQNGGTLLGVPIIRTIVYWGLYWSPLILGNYHVGKLPRIPVFVFDQKQAGKYTL